MSVVETCPQIIYLNVAVSLVATRVYSVHPTAEVVVVDVVLLVVDEVVVLDVVLLVVDVLVDVVVGG